MKALGCRGGKLTRIFCYVLLLISLSIFGSMPFSLSSNFEQASAFSLIFEEMPEKDVLNEINSGTLAGVYNSNDYISILGRTIEVVNTNTTSSTPDYQVARYVNDIYKGKFYFGHNSSFLLDGLADMNSGSVFSITTNGIIHYYRVEHLETVKKTSIMNGEMIDIAMARWNGRNYSVSLMTCAGQSYGNGDASHRTLVFANEI